MALKETLLCLLRFCCHDWNLYKMVFVLDPEGYAQRQHVFWHLYFFKFWFLCHLPNHPQTLTRFSSHILIQLKFEKVIFFYCSDSSSCYSCIDNHNFLGYNQILGKRRKQSNLVANAWYVWTLFLLYRSIPVGRIEVRR